MYSRSTQSTSMCACSCVIIFSLPTYAIMTENSFISDFTTRTVLTSQTCCEIKTSFNFSWVRSFSPISWIYHNLSPTFTDRVLKTRHAPLPTLKIEKSSFASYTLLQIRKFLAYFTERDSKLECRSHACLPSLVTENIKFCLIQWAWNYFNSYLCSWVPIND